MKKILYKTTFNTRLNPQKILRKQILNFCRSCHLFSTNKTLISTRNSLQCVKISQKHRKNWQKTSEKSLIIINVKVSPGGRRKVEFVFVSFWFVFLSRPHVEFAGVSAESVLNNAAVIFIHYDNKTFVNPFVWKWIFAPCWTTRVWKSKQKLLITFFALQKAKQ